MKSHPLIKPLFCLTLVCTLAVSAFGQQQSPKVEAIPSQPQNVIALVPFYSFYRGIRVDYERRIKSGNHWLVAAPQIYTDIHGKGSSFNTDAYATYETMAGFGLNLYFKTIAYTSDKVNWKSGLPRQSLYLQAGPNYQYFSLKNTEEVAIPFVEDGTTYYRFDTQEVKKKINRFGAIVDVGWQLAFDRFLIDLYLGLAVKYSFGEDGELIKSTYAEWVDIDYSGILMDGGVRVGIFF